LEPVLGVKEWATARRILSQFISDFLGWMFFRKGRGDKTLDNLCLRNRGFSIKEALDLVS